MKVGKYYNVNNGIQTGADKVTDAHLRKFPDLKAKKGEGIFVLNQMELKKLQLTREEEKDLIRPLFKNSDIKKFKTENINDQYLIYTDRACNYIPITVKKHFEKYKKILDPRREVSNKIIQWFQVQWPREGSIFSGEKIVCPQRSQSNTFGYNNISWSALTDVFFITKIEESPYNLKVLLGVLCSKTMYYWLYFRGKRKGSMLELLQTPVSEIPLPEIDKTVQTQIERLVNQIIKFGRNHSVELEIEELVAKAYGLTDKEQKEVLKFYDANHSQKSEEIKVKKAA